MSEALSTETSQDLRGAWERLRAAELPIVLFVTSPAAVTLALGQGRRKFSRQ